MEGASRQCPVSLLSEATKTLVMHVARSEFIRSSMMSHGMGGGSGPVAMYGPDLSEWPSYMVDAIEIFQEEDMIINRKMHDFDHPVIHQP